MYHARSLNARSTTILLLFIAFLFNSTALSAKKYPSDHSSDFSHMNAVAGSVGLGAIDGFAGATGMVEYERFLNQSGTLGLNLKAGVFNSGTIGEVRYEQTRINLLGIYLAPGARYHFFGNMHSGDVSAGLTLPIGTLRLKETYITGSSYTVTEEASKKNYFLFAALADIAVDFHRSNGATFGFFTQVGSILANARATQENNVSPLYLTVGIRFGGAW